MSRRRHIRSAEKTLGTSPGTLTYIGDEIEHETRIRRIEYNASDYHIDETSKISACRLPADETAYVTWIDVDGIHEPQVVAAIGKQYKLHPLLLEDVVNTSQKPKIDLYGDDPTSGAVVYVTLKMLHHSRERKEIYVEHISLVLGKNYLVSFQEERQTDIFEPIIERIRASAGKTRRNGADYLLYALMDLIVDHYFLIAERAGDKIEAIEEQIGQEQVSQQTLATLYKIKRELSFIRRMVSPLREMIGVLMRGESDLIQPDTQPFLRDLADHVNQVVEALESERELIAGLMDVYYSIVNNRMNSVMKTLTIVSAIFIPLTLIAGIYGMNFDNMPELHSRTGYFWVIFAMVAIAIGEVIYFKRRGWM